MKMSFIKTEKEILDEIEKVLEKNSEKSEKDLVKAVKTAERTFVSGQGRSGLMAKGFAMRLMQLGLEAYAVGETITPSIAENDLLISVSGSGKTKIVVEIAKEAKKAGAVTACITAEKKSPIAKASGIVIVLKGKTKEGGKSIEPLGSLFEQSALIFLDAVVIGLMKELGKGERGMKKRHSSLE
jgi:6-phospho-3-hexuloisomerase